SLHLNIPEKFLTIWIFELNITDHDIKQRRELAHILNPSIDFGLIFIPNQASLLQYLINKHIRSEIRSDIIVLGQEFVKDIAHAPNPQLTLTDAILREVELTRISPFMAGGASFVPRMFFGREGEIKNIGEAIKTTSVIISCGRRMGKTMLLRRLAQVTLSDNQYNCYFLNCLPIHNYHDLLSEMITAWNQPDLSFDPEHPNSFADVAQSLTSDNSSLPIFLLDEVDELFYFDSKNQWRLAKQLRTLSQDGRARFIMTGEHALQRFVHDADSPFFNFFGYNLELSFLSYQASNRLIEEPFKEMHIGFEEPIPMISTIQIATSGHPYLVQRLCQGLVQSINRANSRVIIPENIENVLNDPHYQDDYFETVWGQAPVLARIITLFLGTKSMTMNEIRQRLNDYGLQPTLTEISESLEVLDLYSVVTRKRGQYSFIATAFPDMVRRAYGDDIEINIELLCEEYTWQQQDSNTKGLWPQM
ncbi:MAG: hypothetical protein AAF639_38020, partial [Chloroflexota bacterium]